MINSTASLCFEVYKLKSLILMSLFILSGCSSTVYVNGSTSGKSLAKLQAEQIGWLPSVREMYAYIIKIEGESRLDSDGSFSNSDVYVLEPGSYTITIRCQNTMGSSYDVYNIHKIKYEAEGNSKYTAYCVAGYDESKFVLNASRFKNARAFISLNENIESDKKNSLRAVQKLADE